MSIVEKRMGLCCYHKFKLIISHFLIMRMINGRIDSLGENRLKNWLCNYLAGYYNHSNPPKSPTDNQITLTATQSSSSIKLHAYMKSSQNKD